MIRSSLSTRIPTVTLSNKGSIFSLGQRSLRFVTFVSEVSRVSLLDHLLEGRRTSDLREFSKFRDFSENRSVLFPSALATIAEESSRRGKQLWYRCTAFLRLEISVTKRYFYRDTDPFRQVLFGTDPKTNYFGDL